MGFLRYLNTIDRRAFALAIIVIGIFIGYVSHIETRAMFWKISDMMGSSHTSRSSDLFCAKKENRKSSYCLDKKAAINDKWSDVVHRSNSPRKSNAFGLTR